MVRPAVVLKSKFVVPESQEFRDYVDYLDRDSAKVKQVVSFDHESDEMENFKVFHSFMDYMGDEEKEGDLFTDTKDSLNENEKYHLKKMFNLAQKNGSPMWQDVISFDNEWLEEQGLYDPATHTLNEEKIRDVTRSAMKEMLRNEMMDESTVVWSASVHYNTDNIHVHIATVEPHPTRAKKSYKDKESGEIRVEYRGKRKQKTIDRMKSKVANEIYNHNKDYERIDELIRNPVKEKRKVNLRNHQKTNELFFQALPLLPKDLKEWRYGYNSVDPARPLIDEIGKLYLEEYHADEMKELYEKLDEQVGISEKLFGSGSNHERYKDNKLKDLRTRMGNAVLMEMREFHKKNRENGNYSYYVKHYYSSDVVKRNQSRKYLRRGFRNNYSSPYYADKSAQVNLIRLNSLMRKSYHEYKVDRDIAEFDRMLEGLE